MVGGSERFSDLDTLPSGPALLASFVNFPAAPGWVWGGSWVATPEEAGSTYLIFARAARRSYCGACSGLGHGRGFERSGVDPAIPVMVRCHCIVRWQVGHVPTK